jgi:hypothetical protein
VVNFLEQSGLADELLSEGARKKEAALAYLTQFAEDKNLPFDYELLDRIIEDAVFRMNLGLDEGFEVLSEAIAISGEPSVYVAE